MAYRRRYVVVVGIGATFVLAHVAGAISAWGPWAAPVLVAAVCGAVIAEGNNGAGVGGLAAGGGGFLFAFGELMDGPLTDAMPLWTALEYSLIQSVNLFALFGLAGMIAGGIAGLTSSYTQKKARSDEDDATAD